ncbi:hypothetical protein GSI_11111 [Ganoderma sinense ZZ0214-1]|uniref:Uncharacterized protein n=1 Tax=Ganoderma sinense ZZ0214-1 TaxID=1077348 RepID=A0A2G8RZ51_9APHY|nr:hypothetical protein GSI_11111 [Ganoderma sinense ZZ0214-1]
MSSSSSSSSISMSGSRPEGCYHGVPRFRATAAGRWRLRRPWTARTMPHPRGCRGRGRGHGHGRCSRLRTSLHLHLYRLRLGASARLLSLEVCGTFGRGRVSRAPLRGGARSPLLPPLRWRRSVS